MSFFFFFFKSFVDSNVPVGKQVKSLARIYFGGRRHYVDLIVLAGKQIYQGRRVKGERRPFHLLFSASKKEFEWPSQIIFHTCPVYMYSFQKTGSYYTYFAICCFIQQQIYMYIYFNHFSQLFAEYSWCGCTIGYFTVTVLIIIQVALHVSTVRPTSLINIFMHVYLSTRASISGVLELKLLIQWVYVFKIDTTELSKRAEQTSASC